MEQDDPGEALSELRERRLGALELLQAAAGSGLAAYIVWALLLQPGFRRVPLRLQVLAAHKCGLRPAVGYELNPWLVGLARLHAWRAGCAGSVCYLREDLWKVSLRDCHNVSVFLAPSVVGLGFASPRGGPGHPQWRGWAWRSWAGAVVFNLAHPVLPPALSPTAPPAGRQAAGRVARRGPSGVGALPPPHLAACGCDGGGSGPCLGL
ncbi:adenine nucleotide translocase lysine N-methyltransferase isoform X3 [Prionailurus viverrinus]|uniref:adenine nucleotide translocase lysine N-methyltransferase isoform X3 n=1 Tax=Prionailurus viverrinus TaxID=61388 RepID=UPI001FF300E7|nr:adenine nucleotide translocase lysine N-methyltransferase isoform X3 [Prionailurus viverrinus]